MRIEIGRRNCSAALVLALAVLVCGGCVVGPGYRSPQPTLTALHGAAAVEQREPPSPPPPLDSWWTGFGDPVLVQIVGRALSQNLDLQASLARVARARAVAQQSGAALLPSGSFTAQALRLHQSLESPIGEVASQFPGYERNQSLYDVGAGASWEVDLFGGLRRNREAAGADAQAAEAEQLAVRVSIAAESADAYLQIRGDQQRLRVAQAQVATDERLRELVRLRLASGAAAGRELAQADALLAQARASVPPLRTALEQQLNRLDVLMGVQPGSSAAALTGDGPIPAVPNIHVKNGADTLLRRRPDIMAAERRLAASNARIGVAISEYYPKVSLAALLGFESLNGGRLLSASTFQPQALAGLRWRLFDFGRVDAEVAQARAADAEALAAYRQTVLRAAEDVENSLIALVQLEDESDRLVEEVNALQRSRDLSLEDYEAGAIALTDVLDADRQLLVAQDEEVRARAGAARAGVSVFRALGGGW